MEISEEPHSKVKSIVRYKNNSRNPELQHRGQEECNMESQGGRQLRAVQGDTQ